MPVPSRAGKLPALARRLVPIVVVASLAALPLPATATPRPTQRDLQRLGDQVSQLDEEINQRSIELDRLTALLTAAQRSVTVQQQALVRLGRRISERAAVQYMGSRLSTVAALLDSSQPSRVVEKAETLDLLAEVDADLVATATAQSRALGAMLVQLAVDRAEQAQAVTALTRRKAEIVRKLQQLQAVRTQVGEPPTIPVPADIPAASGGARTVVRTALAQLGKPYQWGSDGPGSFDCSGLTMYAWRAAGVSLPHSAAGQYAALAHVPLRSLAPGDLVFFGYPIHHVGLYIGNGVMVAAPSSGRVVQVQRISRTDLVGAARP